MTSLLETLITGSPTKIQESVYKILDEKVETHLQTKKHEVVAKIFSQPITIGETVKRKSWNKESIREALEEIVLKEMRSENIIEAMDTPTPSSHPLHKMTVSHGFKLDEKGSNSHGYRHDKGHYIVLHHSGKQKNGFSLVTSNKNSTKQIDGKGHEELARVFVIHSI